MLQSLREPLGFNFALPDGESPIAESFQFLQRFPVPLLVLFYLATPEFCSRGGQLPTLAVVAVPEAAVDEYHRTVLGQDNIRRTGKVLPMQSKPIPHLMKQTPHDHLRSCVFVLHTAHDFGSLGF